MLKQLSNSYKYYRITYNDEGIYNALKNNVKIEIWKKILSSKEINWLPKPPSYSKKNISYFTTKGYEEFCKKTMPIISKYLQIENIKVEVFDKISNPLLYSDKYQVVVTINTNS